MTENRGIGEAYRMGESGEMSLVYCRKATQDLWSFLCRDMLQAIFVFIHLCGFLLPLAPSILI
jgi:hypothetical protein